MSDDGDESTVPVISGGHATGNGTAGNLYIPTGKTFTMECGRIENGHVAKDGPGNIYVQGTLNISGGFISGGYRDNNINNEVKRNIFVYQGTINMSGGTIDGGVMLHLENSKLNISGSARIASTGKLALTANGAVLAIDVATLNNDAYLQLSGTNGNGAIVLDTKVATGPNGTALKASSKQQLFALFGANTSGLFNLGSSTYQLTLESNGSVYLRGGSIHAHCICAGTTTHATGCDGYDRIFQGTTAMPKASNAYYFTKDSDIGQVLLGSSDGSTNVDTVICLNDCTITSSARMALIWGGSSLTLTDCGSNGQVLSSAATASNGGLIHTAANSVFNLYNGTLNAEGLKNQSSGGAIDNAGTLNIYGGSIIGGSAINGGAINNGGTILMSGGSITSGTASASGACIYFSKGSISLSGSPQIDEICIPSGKTISIAETLGAETSVGILCAGLAAGELRSFMDTPASTLAQAQQWSSCFHGSDDSVVVIGEGNNLLLSKAPTGVSLNGGSTYYTMAVATQVAKQSDRMTLHTNHTGDITLSEGAYLDLNGKVLDGSVSVNAGTLYLMDSANADYTYEGGKVTGNITGNVARHFTTNTLSNYGHNYRFLVIQTDAGYSSHRIYLAVKSTVFSPKRFAVNFRTAFKCDSMLADYVNAYGVEATGKTTADPSNYLDSSELVPGNSTANERITQLTNMMQPGMSAAVLENRATTPLQINAYITLTDKLATSADMSNIRSAVVVRTYKSTIEDIDKMELTDSQKTYLGEMYNTYSVVDGTEFMAAWNLSKIPGYAAAIVQEP